MRTLSEGESRFWTAVFGGVTAVALVGGGLYFIAQYETSVENTRSSFEMQIANAAFEAKRPFYQRQLELCGEASATAAILATPATRDKVELKKAEEDFWRLYWGPLGMVEDTQVESAMVEFGACLQGRCEKPNSVSALNLTHACRNLIALSWSVALQDLSAEGATSKNAISAPTATQH